MRIQNRKNQHIEICQHEDVEATDRFTGFEELHFLPQAVPEISYDSLQTQTSFLGREFSYPILITGMTGGVQDGARINKVLAKVASTFNIPMGVGSQRIACEDPAYESMFTLKDENPDLFLIGNLGISQLLGGNSGVDLCQKAVDMIQADALAIHLNIIQEALQKEGDRIFTGFYQTLEKICSTLKVPVVIKEIGAGIRKETAKKLIECGVQAIDVGGKGGTSWSYIEGIRSENEEWLEIAKSFRNWGIPTAYNLRALREFLPELPLIATGGIRNGLTIAKASALGADLVGIGLPLLRAALVSAEKTETLMRSYCDGLKITMIATGSLTLSDLSRSLGVGLPYAFSRERGGWGGEGTVAPTGA